MAEDYASLIPKLLILAQKGEAKAQYHLGVLFNDGKGVPQDFAQAAKWYTQAASQGHIKAQLYLGLLYQKGQGVEQDYRQAAMHYLKAASGGDTKAQYYLGLLFYSGKGVAQNRDEAVKWFKKSAEGGNDEAKALLDKLLKPEKPPAPEVKPRQERLENISELYEPDEDDYNDVLIDEPDDFMYIPSEKPQSRKFNLVPVAVSLVVLAGIAAAFMFFTRSSDESLTMIQNQQEQIHEVVNAPFPDSDTSPEVTGRSNSPALAEINAEDAPPVQSLRQVHTQTMPQTQEFEKLKQEVNHKIPAYIFESGAFMINPDAKNIRVTGTHVRVRSEPNTNSKILRTMNKGNTLPYHGEWTSQADDSWYLTRPDDNNYGWISVKYTEIKND